MKYELTKILGIYSWIIKVLTLNKHSMIVAKITNPATLQLFKKVKRKIERKKNTLNQTALTKGHSGITEKWFTLSEMMPNVNKSLHCNIYFSFLYHSERLSSGIDVWSAFWKEYSLYTNGSSWIFLQISFDMTFCSFLKSNLGIFRENFNHRNTKCLSVYNVYNVFNWMFITISYFLTVW